TSKWLPFRVDRFNRRRVQTDRRLFLDQIDTPIQTQKSEKNAIPSQPLRGLVLVRTRFPG
ncbi:MAG TPA: hypothetical protein VFV49_13485, partial [Thermoanaerobaculia bacterium]|nr:hypothetical protein [Thermoanaerobaculia bacterium]